MKSNSLKLNMLLNVTKGILSIIFPLITFPYVTRVLQVENIGIFNFSNSIINYFVLLAGLGISSYAIREGSRIKDNQNEANKFYSEMISINLVSTIISYTIFIACIIFVPSFRDYRVVLIILSLRIASNLIGVEWIYSIYEDYFYITIRSLIVQILSLIALFVFVKDTGDLINYVFISTIAYGGASIFNFYYSKKYCNICFINITHLKHHIKPILILFIAAVTTTIYVSVDTTLLGFMSNNFTVGIYSVSVKVYSIVKIILSSIVIVSVPRLSYYIGQNRIEEFKNTANDILKLIMTFLLPAVIGLYILADKVVLLISGSNYLQATSSLRILSISLLFCIFATFWGQAILLTVRKEKIMLLATVISALINLLLNYIFIPIYQENAAAFTTLISEFVAMAICIIGGYRYISFSGLLRELTKVIIGCIVIIVVTLGLNYFFVNELTYTIFALGSSISGYLIIEVILKNEALTSIVKGMKSNLTEKFK